MTIYYHKRAFIRCEAGELRALSPDFYPQEMFVTFDGPKPSPDAPRKLILATPGGEILLFGLKQLLPYVRAELSSGLLGRRAHALSKVLATYLDLGIVLRTDFDQAAFASGHSTTLVAMCKGNDDSLRNLVWNLTDGSHLIQQNTGPE